MSENYDLQVWWDAFLHPPRDQNGFLTSSWLFTDERGRILYFRRGLWGRGQVLPSEMLAAQLRRASYVVAAVSSPLLVGLVLYRQWLLASLAALGLIAISEWWSRRLSKELGPPTVRLSKREKRERMYYLFPNWFLALGLFLTLGCTWGFCLRLMLVPGAWPRESIIMLLGIVASACYGTLLFFKLKYTVGVMKRTGSTERYRQDPT